MSQVVVFAFNDEAGAEQMRDALVPLQKQCLIKLADAAIVIRGADGKAQVRDTVSLVRVDTLGAASWGLLIGLLSWAPWLGLALGAVTDVPSGSLSGVGVDDQFVKEVGNAIEPGQSALFLLVEEWAEDKVMEELSRFDARVLQTSLSKEDEARLREALGAVVS